ncbi:MAG: hypothetical protein GY777_08745, partial [Candidatus Brocadiaceae bacterium]|nr:hypothetical protein [Candidatus Brocadiaceae bacterium]
MYTMTRDGNEYVPEITVEGLHQGGIAFIKGLDREVNIELEEVTEDYEVLGGDSYMASSKEMMLWFTECWYKSN